MTGLVKRYAANASAAGRDLIVGDIHGCFGRLYAALLDVGFNPGQGDRLFAVGDLVDRGPQSEAVAEWLALPWFHALRGNHDQMAIDWAGGETSDPSWYAGNGGAWFMQLEVERQHEIADALAALPLVMELETPAGLLGMVHAECPLAVWQDFTGRLEDPALPPRELDVLKGCAQWMTHRRDFMEASDVAGVRAVVVGHSIVPRYTSLGNTLYIDTGAFKGAAAGGFFTIVDSKTLQPACKPSSTW